MSSNVLHIAFVLFGLLLYLTVFLPKSIYKVILSFAHLIFCLYFYIQNYIGQLFLNIPVSLLILVMFVVIISESFVNIFYLATIYLVFALILYFLHANTLAILFSQLFFVSFVFGVAKKIYYEKNNS